MITLRKLLDVEPIRVLGYVAVVALAGYLVTRGIIDNDTRALLLAAAAAVLGTAGTEAARAKVTPIAIASELAVTSAQTALATVQAEAAKHLGAEAATTVADITARLARECAAPRNT